MDSFPLLESAPDAMVIVDIDGRIHLLNGQAEKLFGYAREELLSRPIEVLVPQRLRSRHTDNRAVFARDPHARPMGAGLELYAMRKDGSEIPVEISLSPIRSERGAPMIVSAIRDVSERKRYEQTLQEKNLELETASTAKDQFLASMSHELRTPLNAIIGFTGTLLMKLPGPLTADQEKQLRIVQTSARHLLSLINDILDLARIETGKIELHLEPVSIGEVIADIKDSLRSFAADKRLEFGVSLPEVPIVVRADRRAVHQIVLNLANNAIKYTDHGSVAITVSARRGGERPEAIVDVTDTGIGIKTEDRERLFQAFEQLDPSSTRRVEGVGLGLYLSLKLTTLLGGSLGFTSEHGKGSTFTLALPLDAA